MDFHHGTDPLERPGTPLPAYSTLPPTPVAETGPAPKWPQDEVDATQNDVASESEAVTAATFSPVVAAASHHRSSSLRSMGTSHFTHIYPRTAASVFSAVSDLNLDDARPMQPQSIVSQDQQEPVDLNQCLNHPTDRFTDSSSDEYDAAEGLGTQSFLTNVPMINGMPFGPSSLPSSAFPAHTCRGEQPPGPSLQQLPPGLIPQSKPGRPFERPALIVCSAQVAPRHMLRSDRHRRALEVNHTAIIAAWQDCGGPVIFVDTINGHNDSTKHSNHHKSDEAGNSVSENLLSPVEPKMSFRADHEGSRPLPYAQERTGKVVLFKSGNSIFEDTSLAALLRLYNRDSILLIGYDTPSKHACHVSFDDDDDEEAASVVRSPLGLITATTRHSTVTTSTATTSSATTSASTVTTTSTYTSTTTYHSTCSSRPMPASARHVTFESGGDLKLSRDDAHKLGFSAHIVPGAHGSNVVQVRTYRAITEQR
ncbi:hypothetical protein OC844_005425 [Tilletia horrida]|nr:hypothetical protein OC844_005425 [Tilletia horrida]